MKTISNVTMLENSAGTTQFSNIGISRNNTEKTPSARPAIGTLGLRTGATTIPQDKVSQAEIAKEIAAKTQSKLTDLSSAVEKADASNFAGPDSSGGNSAPTGSVVSDLVSQYSLSDVFTGILARPDPKKHSQTLCDIYRDMYYHDTTCGSTIELLATIPFSDFSLTGVKDEKMARVFLDSVEAMNCELLLPNISVDYNCLGGVVLSTKWDDGAKAYRGVVPHRLDYCEFTQVPVFGIDPLISVSIPAYLTESLTRDEVKNKYKDLIPNDLLKSESQSSGGGKVKGVGAGVNLTPEDTIFIPRRGHLKDFSGISLLRRALPAWLYEKALIRGTLDQVYKRQRAVGHITVEHTEEFVPTPEEMNAIAAMFLNADLDPLGSIVVTRGGVSYNDVRRGDDFWRWDQNYDQLEKIKLRALGTSEAFISADATYNQMEQALSVFMENVKDYRSRITREMFYEKTFLRISMAHGYTKKRSGSLLTTEMASMYGESGIFYNDKHELVVRINSDMPVAIPFAESAANVFGSNSNDFVIPTVVWRKRLMPEADESYMQVLSLAEEKGVPVTLRHWIAGAGMQVDTLMQGLDDDLRLREKVYEYQKELAELKREFGVGDAAANEGQSGEDGEGGGVEELEMARYLANRSMNPTATTPRKSILARANPDSREAEIANLDSAGKRRILTRKGRAIRLERYNKIITEASVEIARRENVKIKKQEDMLKDQATSKIYT